MKLEKIDFEHKKMIEQIKKEYDSNNEDYNGAFFIKNYDNYDELINSLNNYSNGIMDNPSYVPYTCYVLIENDEIVAVGSLRHYLNDYLKKFGGHIGYSVVPSKRNKGYGTKMLELILEKAKEMKIDEILVTCNANNIGSQKVIENNKGKLIDKINENNSINFKYIIDNK